MNFHKLINEIYDIFEHFEDLSLNLKTQQINMNVQKEATKLLNILYSCWQEVEKQY